MDISKLTRDPAAVAKTFKELPNDSLISLTGHRIHIPSKYVSRQLAVISKQGTYILGIFALITPDGKYSVFNFPCLTRIIPSDTKKVVYDGVEYLEFDIAKGSPIIADMNVLVQDTLIYHIYDHFVDGGIVPWFMDYTDFIAIFDLVRKYLGVRLGATRTVVKTILGQIARVKGDVNTKLRETIKTQADIAKADPSYVSFSSVLYGPKTTSAKLMGPHFDTAVVSSIVNPSVTSDNLEQIQRS